VCANFRQITPSRPSANRYLFAVLWNESAQAKDAGNEKRSHGDAGGHAEPGIDG
jgi:hypothetical protein